MLKQLSNVLQVSRLEADAVEIKPRPTEQHVLAEGIENILEASVSAFGKALAWRVILSPLSLPTVMIDRHGVMQIVYNLIDNSVRFTSSGVA